MASKLTSRSTDYSKWYNELVIKADLAEYPRFAKSAGIEGDVVNANLKALASIRLAKLVQLVQVVNAGHRGKARQLVRLDRGTTVYRCRRGVGSEKLAAPR